MPKEHTNDIKLGIFLIAGLLVIVFSLYMIGKDRSLFAGNFTLRTRFRDVAGLMTGNNVRYSGIQTGTVKSIRILDDTTIEVTMYVDKAARSHIRKNSIASIGTEGLMGNKVVNIMPGDAASLLVEEGDILPTSLQGNLGVALGTLSQTNENAAIIAQELVQTVRQINSSPVLKRLLTDTSLPANMNVTMVNIRMASARINNAANMLEATIADMHRGTGTIGLLMADNDSKEEVQQAIRNIQKASIAANTLVQRLDSTVASFQSDMESQTGAMHVLLRDTAFAGQLERSMINVESGTASFSQNMEALKHSFLTKGYFKRQEKQNRPKN